MKIAMLGQKGIPAHSGGVERHVDGLATRLVEAGHKVVVYCRKYYMQDKSYPYEYRGVELAYLPTIRTKYFDAITHTFLATLDVVFRRRDVDIIHYHGIGPALCSWIPRVFRPRLRVLVTYHCQDYFQGKWGAFARTMLRIGEWCACAFAHEIIAVSKQLQNYMQVGYDREAIYIPNSVSLPERTAPRLIKEYGLTSGGYYLIVSRLVPHKGVHHVIEAYERLADEGVVLPKLVIVGGGSHTNSYVKQLHEMAESNPNVIMLGERHGVFLDELYSNAALFIQPSEMEGLSVALLEAMSYGLPVLVSDIAENKEVLSHVGRTFHNKDVADLGKQLQVINTLDMSVWRSEASANRAHVERYYEAARVFDQSLAAYTRLMARA